MNKDFFNKRALSWSAISSFEYDPDSWYKKYILNEKQKENKEMIWGKIFAKSCEDRKPLAAVTLYSKVEYPLNVVFNGIKLTGWIDTYEPHKKLGEMKTGKLLWNQKRVDEHGQLDMYALQLFIQHKVKPEKLDIQLQWIPTIESGDFRISFSTDPPTVHTFKTKRSMVDILRFGARINETVSKMIEYANQKDKQPEAIPKETAGIV